MALAAVALFCEDIREERSGSTTLVGIMSDNVQVPSVPGALPKLAIYIRIHLDVSDEIRPLQLILQFPDGNEHGIGDFSTDLIEKTRDEAKGAGNSLVGLIGNVVAGNFPVPAPGRVTVKLKCDGQDQVIGSLNFTILEQPN